MQPLRRGFALVLAADLFLLLLLASHARSQGLQKFHYLVSVAEYASGHSGEEDSLYLSYDAEFWYSDLWTFDPVNERQALRFTVDLPAAAGNVQVNKLEIYEDYYLEYTWCRDSCGFDDLFGKTPMPQLWCPTTGGSSSSGSINGVSAANLTTFEFNDGFVELWCHAVTLLPVRAVLHYDQHDKQIDFIAFLNSTFDNDVFEPADFCPQVDPGCFRLDLAIVLDHSSSVRGPWRLIVDFVWDLAETFVINPRRINIGVVGTSILTACYSMGTNLGYTEFIPLSDNKDALLEALQSLFLEYPLGCTPLIKAINGSLDMLINGRPNTRKALLVLSDGKGNNPCTDYSVCSDYTLTNVPNCVTSTTECTADNTCNFGLSCEDKHDSWYPPVWAGFDATFGAEAVPVFAVATGTGSDISLTGLSLIARGITENIFVVSDFTDLSSLTYTLAKALSCPVPGSIPCPNNCRPGGLCCAGSCECIQDCSMVAKDKCQKGVCLVTKERTSCVALGSACSDGSSDDTTGIIAGAVVGGVIAVAVLLALLAGTVALICFLQRKTAADIIALEQAFANLAAVKENPAFEERKTDFMSPLYEGNNS